MTVFFSLDPFSLKRNVARSISNSTVVDFIHARLRKAYLYYGIPQTGNGPLFQSLSVGGPPQSEMHDLEARYLEGKDNSDGNSKNVQVMPPEHLTSGKDFVPLDKVTRQMQGVTIDDLSFCFDEDILTDGQVWRYFSVLPTMRSRARSSQRLLHPKFMAFSIFSK